VGDMSIDFNRKDIKAHMWEGNFGLEKESLRVTPEGFLAHTKHPFPDDPRMERDFCENQTELITDVAQSADEVWEKLAYLQKKAVKTLLYLNSGKEFLWPFSNPPYVKNEDDIPIASYQGSLHGKTMYREYLAKKYGKRKMLFSGIHFNFSFSDEFLQAGYEGSDSKSLQDYKNRVYLELAKKATKYSWLIVYLTAASSVMDGSLFQDNGLGKDVDKNLASPRCSKIGYWNEFDPILEYDTLEHYVESIESYVESGQLQSASELYYPVRLKPRGENSLERLKNFGVDHIELRMLDLNPLEPVGIRKDDVKFLHLLLLYLLSLEDAEFYPFEQIMAVKNEKRAATYDEEQIYIETGWNSALPIRKAALYTLSSMEKFFLKTEDREAVSIVRKQEQKIFCPKERYAVQIREQFRNEYVKSGVDLAKEHAYRLAYE
jgi:glutamate--cysteine ligase